jgi:hypothetical protein
MAAAMADVTLPPVGDVQTRRAMLEPVMAQTGAAQPIPPDVERSDHQVTTADGADILLRWFKPAGPSRGPRPSTCTAAA